MILFEKDWEKYPSAIPDLKTSNTSFVRYAGLLKSMGNKNHSFCLALHNPKLSGLDPRSKDLTPKQIVAIVKECKNNPWYIFREIIRLPPNGNDTPVPLQANRGNISLYWLFFNHVTSLLIQPRQTGKSVSTDVLMSSLLNILTINSKIHLLTKDDSLRVANIKRIKEIITYLPYYLRLKTKTDSNNTEKITVNRLGNSYLTAVPQASVKAAKNIGRGLTITTHHIDELAFINNLKHTLSGLLATSTAARDSASKANSPYGNIFTTTSGYLNTESGEFAKVEIYDKSLRWTEMLYDSNNMDELHETIKTNSPSGELRVLLEFNHRQLGKTDAWLKDKISSSVSKGEDAGADYLNIWADGGSESALDKKTLTKLNDSKVNDPYHEISTHGYITRWYVPSRVVLSGEIKSRKLVMGLDTSEAVGNDDIAMNIRDVSTGEVIATGTYNETNTMLFASWIGEWLINYPNITLCVERRSTGASILDHLLLLLPSKNIDPFKRIFNWVADGANENSDYYDIINMSVAERPSRYYDKYRKEFGYATSGSGKQSRDNLYGEALNASIAYTSNVTRDPDVINQLSRLIRKNNRIDHRPGEHDDAIIAWLLCYWFLSKAKNKHIYGLVTREVLSVVNLAIISKAGGLDAIAERKEKLLIKHRIDTLLQELSNPNLPGYRKKIITGTINRLNSELGDDSIVDLNIDSLLERVGKVKPSNETDEKKLRPFKMDGYSGFGRRVA